jgi:hypothetical protein
MYLKISRKELEIQTDGRGYYVRGNNNRTTVIEKFEIRIKLIR